MFVCLLTICISSFYELSDDSFYLFSYWGISLLLLICKRYSPSLPTTYVVNTSRYFVICLLFLLLHQYIYLFFNNFSTEFRLRKVFHTMRSNKYYLIFSLSSLNAHLTFLLHLDIEYDGSDQPSFFPESCIFVPLPYLKQSALFLSFLNILF